jgi:outer membrane protein assembly factor BamB
VTGRARPFDAAGNVKWKLFTGMSMMAPPTVGVDAVIGLSNDTYVHAMLRGPLGGTWPAPWKPISLGAVAQYRAPVVPLPAGSRAFIATQDGWVQAVDTSNGNLLWSTQLPEGDVRGAPAGIFTSFGGKWDYVLVGTSSGTNDHLYALDPASGAVIDAFPGPADGAIGSIGAILGAPAVDYAGNGRVYFASRLGSASETLWCLDLGPASDALRLGWKSGAPDEITVSPVLANGRVYVVDIAGFAWSIRASDGLNAYSLDLSDGDGKGFVFPDRRNTDLYVATQTQVHGLTDTLGSALGPKPGWASPLTIPASGHPSVVLLQPGTDNLYVGVDQPTAGLLRIDAASGTIASSLPLESSPLAVGAPSLDIGFDLIHVGSGAGILYAVELPF